MVSIIENWVSIHGIVKSVNETSGLKEYFQVTLELQKTTDIEGFPNLAKADEGSVININARPEQIEKYQIKSGSTLSCKGRKAFGQVYFIE